MKIKDPFQNKVLCTDLKVNPLRTTSRTASILCDVIKSNIKEEELHPVPLKMSC